MGRIILDLNSYRGCTTVGDVEGVVMTFQFRFVGGPLDGLVVNGASGELPRNHYDFAAVAFRDSEGGRLGVPFETFNPYTLVDLPSPRPAVRLHIYRITSNCVRSGFIFIKAH